MSVVDEINLDAVEERFRKGFTRVIEAEKEGVSEHLTQGRNKNTGFFIELKKDTPEQVAVRINRLHDDCGFRVEIMVVEDYFDGADLEEESSISVSDGGEVLVEFVDRLGDIVLDELSGDYEWDVDFNHALARNRIVFSDVFYLD